MGYIFSALIGSAVIFMALATEINYEMYRKTRELEHQGKVQQAEFVHSLDNAVVSWLQQNASSCTSGSSCTIADVCSYLQSQTNSLGQPYYMGSCTSPLGESGWELVYDAQGNYVLQSTQFNPSQFQKYIPVASPSYTISPGVTIADKVLTDALIKHAPQLLQSSKAVGVTDVYNSNGAVNGTPGLVSYTNATSFMQYIQSQLGF